MGLRVLFVLVLIASSLILAVLTVYAYGCRKRPGRLGEMGVFYGWWLISPRTVLDGDRRDLVFSARVIALVMIFSALALILVESA